MNSRLYKYELKPFFSCGKRGEDLYLYNEESNVIETRYYIAVRMIPKVEKVRKKQAV